MTKQKKVSKSIEKIDTSIDRNRENLTILKWIDDGNFDKLVKWFSSEKEQNKVVLSWFLNSTNVTLWQLWTIKIDINHIKNYIRNKPDISKDLEKKIAKLFLKKLYELWATNTTFITQIKDAFGIENGIDIENKSIDFKTIQVNISKLSPDWNETINSVTVSNDEIFDLLWNEINKIANFESQSLSSRDIILDILQFEVKGIIDYVKWWWKDAEKDMIKSILPTSMISEIFNKVKDPEIEELTVQKLKLQWSDAEKCKELNQKIWKKYIENFEKMWMNKDFISTLKKLLENDFNFAQLDKKEQTVLRNTLIADNIDQAWNKRANYTKFNQKDFKEFMQKLYDFENDNINIEVAWRWNINLKIKKSVKEWSIPSFSDVENFKNMDAINPIKFIVNIDNNDEEIIKDLEDTKDSPLRSDWIMETHITKWWELNIWNGYKLEICGKIIAKSQLDELLECDYDEDKLNQKLKDFWLYDELKDLEASVKKKMFSPENVHTDFDENGVAQNNDQWYWPYWYRFCIFEEMLKSLDVKIVERNLIFDWKNVDKLSQIYVMSKLWWDRDLIENQDRKINNLLDAAYDSEELGDAESGKAKAEELWNDIKSGYQNEYKPNKGEEGYENFSIYDSLENGGTIYANAKKYRESLDDEWKKAFREKLIELCEKDSDIEEEDRKDVIGEIDDLIDYLEHPHSATTSDDWSDEPKKVEKTDEEKFKETWDSLQWDKECPAFGVWTRLYFDLWESQLPPIDITDAEKSFYCFKIESVDDINQTFTLKAIWWDLPSSLTGNVYTLKKSQLESMKKWWSIYKVRADNTRDWISCIESINKAWFFKKFTTFWNMEWQVKLEWNKFVNQKWEEIKYFDRMEWVFDDSDPDKWKWWQWVKIYKYEIKGVDTSKWTVKLASQFDSHDENYNDVIREYENEIPFEQFILLMEWKRLKWYTEDQQKEMETKYNINDPKRLPTKWMRKWISIWAIINVFKNTTKALKSKIDERNKQQEEDLEDYLFSYEWLDLYGKLWWLFWNSAIWDAIRKTQYEFYTNRENRTRKRIEEWYKIFETDPQYSEFFGDHLLAILDRQWYVWNDKDRYKFAAAFLIMVKKEWPYPRAFANQKDRWKRVENLLWPEHKIRFLNFYEKKKDEIQQAKDLWYPSWDRLEKQEELNKMEIQYIISTIDGRAPYGPCSNEYMLKSLWSKNFMSKLEENINWYYNNHEAEKNKLETFYSAEESYLRNLWSGKFQAALPALERMCETAKTPWEVFRIKWYLLGAMLMWIVKNDTTAKTIKSFWATCRSMWFAPWYRMRDIEHQDKVKILLDGVTNGEFSKDPNLKINLSDFEPWNIKDWKYSFWKIFQSYWNSHGKDILKKIENPTYKDGPLDKSVVDLANEKDNPNNYVFKEIIKNSTTNEIDTKWNATPIFAQESPLTATSNMVKEFIPRNWKYSKLRSEEDLSNAEDFWTRANDVIPNADVESDQETVNFVFKKFFNRFDDVLTTETQKMILRSLPLIQEEAKYSPNNARYMLWYMLKGNMHDKTHWAFPTEFNQVVDKFVDFFNKNIQKINEGTIKAAFDDDDVIRSFSNPYVLLWLRKFYSKYMNWWWKDRTNYKKNADLSLLKLKNPKRRDDTINDKIEELWKRTKEYGTPNVPFDLDSPKAVKVLDLPNHDVDVEMQKLWETRY